MRKWSKAFFIAVLTILPITLPVAIVKADRPSGTFEWHIGDAFLAAFDPAFGADSISMAGVNGDTITVNGTGTLSVQSKSATGGGMFVHRNTAGNEIAHGTWEARALISFVSYGDASPQQLPSFLFGGKAMIRVKILVGGTPVHDGILTVFCELGSRIPASVHDGITLNVQDAINFNKLVSGFTVFKQ